MSIADNVIENLLLDYNLMEFTQSLILENFTDKTNSLNMHMLILFTCKTKHIRHADSPSKEWEALHGGSWEAPGELLRIGILLGNSLESGYSWVAP